MSLRIFVFACFFFVAAAIPAVSTQALITLGEFKATAQADGSILVTWRTETEDNTAAFRVYRALSATGPWDEVDEQPAQGDGVSPTEYEFLDPESNLESGTTYYYLLEEIQSDSTTNRYEDRIAHATAGSPGEATDTPTPTITPTSTSGPSPTPTATRTPTPTRTPTRLPTDAPTDVPTATRQFANTPTRPATPTSTATPAAGQPTATRTATVTPITAPQVATPTGQAGAAAPPPLPTATRPVGAAPATATSTRPPTRMPSRTATVGATLTPSATPAPVVFGANTPAEPILRGTLARADATATPGSRARSGENWALIVGLGSVVLAGLLGGAAIVLWRRRGP